MAEKSVPRLMIVTGDDSFAMELARDKYLERVKAARGAYMLEMFDSSNEKIDDFLTRAVTASLFGEVRVFCVLHAQSLTEKELKELDGTLDYDIPDVYMFVSAELEKRSAAETKIKKALRLKERGGKGGAVSALDFSKPREWEMAGKIVEMVPEFFSRRIGKPDAEYLAEVVEYDLIYSELQKIDLALPPGAPIDKKAIEEIAGATRTMSVYELSAALGKRDLPGALKVLDSLFATGFYAPVTASTLFKHFWSLFKIKKYLEKNPAVLKQYNSRVGFGKDSAQSMAAFEIGLACGLLTEKDRAGNRAYGVIIKSGVVSQSQSFTSAGLRDIMKMLQRFDVDVKTGRTEPVPYNLQMLCYRIARAA